MCSFSLCLKKEDPSKPSYRPIALTSGLSKSLFRIYSDWKNKKYLNVSNLSDQDHQNGFRKKTITIDFLFYLFDSRSFVLQHFSFRKKFMTFYQFFQILSTLTPRIFPCRTFKCKKHSNHQSIAGPKNMALE